MRMAPRLLAGLAGVAGLAGPVVGQGPSLGAGRLVATPAADVWSAGWFLPRLGVFRAAVGGIWIDGQDGDRFGPHLDLDLFRGSGRRWYAVASVSGGLGTSGASSPWGAWSLGAGYRLVSWLGADLGLEGRLVHLSTPQDAFGLGLRLTPSPGGRVRTVRPGAPPTPVPIPEDRVPLSIPAPAGDAAALTRSVVQAALDAMGTPYAWGGSSANGYDCSGLIQYAYGHHGVALPRRSADQARAGRLVPRDLAGLLPGDVLTFSASPGGPVSHVGLYVGDRRFIHSASDGVRLSLLSPEDPAGRYWYERWVGVRRMVE